MKNSSLHKVVTKTLSLIVPSYNMEAYLPICLESLIIDDSVQFSKLEVIVVNDGSRDKTSTIAHDFALRYPDVFKVIDKPNGNYGSCINAALPKTTGRFVKILDADDSFDRGRFLELMRFLDDADESIDVVITPFVQVDQFGAIVKEIRYECPINQMFGREEFNKKLCWVYMHSVAYRTGLLRKIAYMQTEGISYTDTEWVFRPIAAAKKFIYVDFLVYRYLVGREGQTVSKEATVRSFGSYMKLLEAMSFKYAEMAHSGEDWNYVSLSTSMRRIALLIYTIEILDLNLGDVVREFDKTDLLIRSNCPDLYQGFEESMLSRTFHWRYIRFMRTHRRYRLLYVAMLRFYSVLTRIRGRLSSL